MNKNSNRNTGGSGGGSGGGGGGSGGGGGGGGQNRPGKSSAYPQKQPRSGDEGRLDKNRDQQQQAKAPREQRQPRR